MKKTTKKATPKLIQFQMDEQGSILLRRIVALETSRGEIPTLTQRVNAMESKKDRLSIAGLVSRVERLEVENAELRKMRVGLEEKLKKLYRPELSDLLDFVEALKKLYHPHVVMHGRR